VVRVEGSWADAPTARSPAALAGPSSAASALYRSRTATISAVGKSAAMIDLLD
jgi:hypothetical protein